MYCDSFACTRRTDVVPEGGRHMFYGYGYYLCYHPECCPRSYDGTTCGEQRAAIRPGESVQSKTNREGEER